jgi:thioredoxin 1
MAYTREYTATEPTREEIDAMAGPLVIEFGAPWCGYCIETQPALAEVLAKHSEVNHIKIYDGKGKPLGRSFRVKLWPTLVFMRDGKLLHRAVRPRDEEIHAGICAIVPDASDG